MLLDYKKVVKLTDKKSWKEIPVKSYAMGPYVLKKHYKKDNIHAYIYERGNYLELIRGKIIKGKFKKISSKLVKDTFDNYQKLVKSFR